MDGTPIIVKKKKSHDHGHHGGSWKVAYADFVTAMMAFFLVMWIMGLSDESKAQIAGYFNDPMGHTKSAPMSRNILKLPSMDSPRAGKEREGETVRRMQEREKLEELANKIQGTIADDPRLKGLSKHIEIMLTPEGLRLEFLEDKQAVFFESGSAVVRPAARRLIRKLGPLLVEARRPIAIEGHTDAQPFKGSGYDNWDLSVDRARAMAKELGAAGVAGKQFAHIQGFADTRLKYPKQPTHFANRRVSLLLPLEQAPEEPTIREQLRQDVDAQFHPPLGIVPETPVRR
jgi:chemotaxis protein MotB